MELYHCRHAGALKDNEYYLIYEFLSIVNCYKKTSTFDIKKPGKYDPALTPCIKT